MGVTLHAIVLLALPLGTVGLLLFVPHLEQANRRPLRSAGAAAGLSIGVFFLTARWQPGLPLTQCFIPGLTIWLVWFYVRDRRLRHWLTGFIIVVMFTLSHHYGVLVRSGHWIGDVQLHALAIEDVNLGWLLDLKRLVRKECFHDRTVYPSGWLEDMPFAAIIRDEIRERKFHRVEVKSVWHSRHTRLFRYRDVPLAVWFPGGQPAQGADSMVLRERLASVPAP